MKPEAKKIERPNKENYHRISLTKKDTWEFNINGYSHDQDKFIDQQLTQERDELKERLRPENDEAAHKLKTLKEGIEDAVQCESNHYWREELRRLLKALKP